MEAQDFTSVKESDKIPPTSGSFNHLIIIYSNRSGSCRIGSFFPFSEPTVNSGASSDASEGGMNVNCLPADFCQVLKWNDHISDWQVKSTELWYQQRHCQPGPGPPSPPSILGPNHTSLFISHPRLMPFISGWGRRNFWLSLLVSVRLHPSRNLIWVLSSSGNGGEAFSPPPLSEELLSAGLPAPASPAGSSYSLHLVLSELIVPEEELEIWDWRVQAGNNVMKL